MIRHVSALTWVADATDEQIRRIEEGLSRLPAEIPQLRSYVFGRDLGLADTNASFGVVADFDSVDDFIAYRDHPAHQRILTELIRPILAARAAVQHELS